ncbi:DUF4157 domain-containing protein [Streptomyces sp. NBC_01591]|nr:DUF4157 domain-containing protein [Streptomyces sp. NBC_01591]WSD73446.1 DUF4157 domain-containing protein [Streptomyces sp. NBC_01591]
MTSFKPAATPHSVPLGLLALQADVGNAAVVQMLRQAGHVPAQSDQHQHGPDCGHQEGRATERPAVQRSAVHEVLRTRGRPLDKATRTDMEARLDADFSDVRIHNDSTAKASAAEIGARAYTSGNHIVLGDGGGTKHTLAHELTHVIQQRQGPVTGTDNGAGLKVSDPSDRFEREAEANATRLMSAPSPQGGRLDDGQNQADRSAGSGEPTVQRAIGLEIEVDRPVVRGNGENVMNGNSTGFTLAENQQRGIKVVSDARWLPDKSGLYTNAEIVSGPASVLPGEEFSPLSETLDHLEDAHSRLYRPTAGSPNSEKQMKALFADEGYVPKEGFKTARVAPENPHVERGGPDGGGLFVHETVGVPLHGMAGFFTNALNEPDARTNSGNKIRSTKNHSERHLAKSLEFGAALAEMYATSMFADDQAMHVDREELRGFGTLYYTQVAALADKGRKENPDLSGGQIKNKTAALSRVGLDSVRTTLSGSAQEFLRESSEEIDDIFWRHYREVNPMKEGERIATEDEAILRTYTKSALQGDQPIKPGYQAHAFGGMTELPGPDFVQGVPVIPLEMRSFGPSLTNFPDLREDVGLLEKWSREAFDGALAARNGTTDPSAQQQQGGQPAVTWEAFAGQAIKEVTDLYYKDPSPQHQMVATLVQVAARIATSPESQNEAAECINRLIRILKNELAFHEVRGITNALTRMAPADTLLTTITRRLTALGV